jgi:hypothetical protein
VPTLHLNICRYRKINQYVNLNRCSCSSCVLTLTHLSPLIRLKFYLATTTLQNKINWSIFVICDFTLVILEFSEFSKHFAQISIVPTGVGGWMKVVGVWPVNPSNHRQCCSVATSGPEDGISMRVVQRRHLLLHQSPGHSAREVRLERLIVFFWVGGESHLGSLGANLVSLNIIV